MARKDKKQAQQASEMEERVLDVDASMQGTMTFHDPVNLRISGKFEGELKTRGQLTIGERAEVRADIEGESITIAGYVMGDVVAHERIELIGPARMVGNLTTPRLQVQDGSVFHGQCQMIFNEPTGAGPAMSAEELARYLEVDEASIEDWASSGRIPARRQGDGWVFERAAVDQWVATERIK